MEQDARRAEPRTNGVLPRQTLQLFDAAQGLRDEPCPGLAAADTAVVRILRDSSVIPCGTLSMRKRVTEACGLGAAPGRLQSWNPSSLLREFGLLQFNGEAALRRRPAALLSRRRESYSCNRRRHRAPDQKVARRELDWSAKCGRIAAKTGSRPTKYWGIEPCSQRIDHRGARSDAEHERRTRRRRGEFGHIEERMAEITDHM